MTTGNESPQSITSILYYRGVSITITKRDEEAKIKPLVEKQLAMIDWMLDEKQCLPSWNKQTNEEVGKPIEKPIETNPDEKECPLHPGIIMKKRTGKYGDFYSHTMGQDATGKANYCNQK